MAPITENASFTQNNSYADAYSDAHSYPNCQLRLQPQHATVQVTVQTNLAGLTFTVDNITYSSTQTFSWVPGSSHTIGTTSPQNGGTGVRYVGLVGLVAELSHTLLRLPLTRPTQRISPRNIT